MLLRNYRRWHAHVALAGTLVAALACNPGPIGGTEDGGDSDSGSEADLPQTCDPPMEMCGDDCVDLQTNSRHCGECDVTCVGDTLDETNVGMCEAGVCPPHLQACMEPYSDTTCADVCEQFGVSCVEQGCEAATMLWWQVPFLAPGVVPELDCSMEDVLTNPNFLFQGSCDATAAEAVADLGLVPDGANDLWYRGLCCCGSG